MSSSQLSLYNEAVRAIAAAVAVDEVKDIHDRAAALQAAAEIAQNRQSEVQFAEIVLRARRRLGAMLAEQKKTTGLNPGTRGQLIARGTIGVPDQGAPKPPTLKELGIPANLSSQAQKLAAVSDDKFEGMLAEWRTRVADQSVQVTRNLLREGEKAEKRAARATITLNGGTVQNLHELVASGFQAGVIYIDCPWEFITRSAKGEDRSAVQHYDVMSMEALKALPIAALAAPNCVLLPWVLDWCEHWAWDLLKAWTTPERAFQRVTTAFTYVKLLATHDGTPRLDGKISDRDFHMGQGYWTRANPETCWLVTCGRPERLDADVRQLVVAPVMDHSRKPDIRERIERLCPGPYLELFARTPRRGWLTWSNELPFSLPAPRPPEPRQIDLEELTARLKPPRPAPSPELPNPGYADPFEAPERMPHEQWLEHSREQHASANELIRNYPRAGKPRG